MYRDVSLLLDHGHAYARRYPIWQLQVETLLVSQRLNREFATVAALHQQAILATEDKGAMISFRDTLKKLDPDN